MQNEEENDVTFCFSEESHKRGHKKTYPQLVSDSVFLIVKGESLNSSRQRWRIHDAERIMSHDPRVLVEGQTIHLHVPNKNKRDS